MPKRPKRMPLNISEFEKEYGWKTKHALGLLGGLPGEMLPLSQRTEAHQKIALTKLALTYKSWFENHPNKTHLFPLTGTLFAYEFARGVRDALGYKTRLKSMTATGKDGHEHTQMATAKKLGLYQTGIVLHDYTAWGSTKTQLANASGIDKRDIVTHNLSQFDFGKAKVPINGREREITAKTLYEKDTAYKLKLKTGKTLSTKERLFIRNAMYSAGYAAAKELLQKK